MRTLSHGLRGALIAIALLAGTARGSGGFLGVNVNDGRDGVQVLSVRDGSAAATAGLVPGDIVAAIGDRSIATPDDLSDALSKASPGDTVHLKLRRSGADQVVSVTLGARPVEGIAATMTPAEPMSVPAHDAPVASLPAIPLIPSPAAPAMAIPAPPTPPEIVLAAPVAPVAKAMDEAPRKGGFLGVTLDGSSGSDNVIGMIVDDSPAAKAKLKVGDQIVAIDGVEVATAEAISAELTKKTPGEDIEIAVLRDGQRKLRTAKLGSYGSIGFPDAAMAPVPAMPAPSMEKTEKKASKEAPAGVIVRSKTAPAPDAKQEPKKSAGRGWLGVYLDPSDGVTIESTAQGGPAEGAGLKAGDKILRVGKKEIGSTDDLLGALEGKSGEDVAIVVMRDGAEKRIGVMLGTPPTDMAAAAPVPAEPMTAPAPAAKAKKKADAAKAEVDEETMKKLEQLGEMSKAAMRKQAAETEKRVLKDAAEQTEKIAKESARQVEKRAKEAAEKARAKAKDAEKSATASAKNRAASPSATWFFPTGTEMSVRIEEKDGGYWITSGSGKQGIEVPADAITNLSIEAKGGGVEVRTFSGGAEPKALSFSVAGSGASDFNTTTGSSGNFVLKTVPEGSDTEDEVIVMVQGEGDDEPRIVSRRKLTDGERSGGEHGVFTFGLKSDTKEPKILQWHGTADGGDIMVRRESGEKHPEVRVEKGEVHVVPHAPHGGGIVIHNNGGTVIIGDAAAHALRAHEGKEKVKVKAKKDTD